MLKIDELNNLEYDDEEVVQKLEKYFDAMDDITPQELDDRVSLGKDIFDLMMLFMFMVAGTNAVGGYQDIEYYINMIQTSYATLITRFGIDDYLDDYVKRFSTEVVSTTFDNIDDEYYTSADRALFIAENEPNTVLNYDRYRNALEQGKTHKKWLTERDNRVRKTHKAVESVTIPIKELFHVGDSLMRFPHDVEYGAHPKEYIRCRCNVEYLPNDKNEPIKQDTEQVVESDNKTQSNIPLNLQFFGYDFHGLSSIMASEILEKEAQEWIKSLTSEQRRSIRKYAYNYGDENAPFKEKLFFRINAMLRGSLPKDSRLMYYTNEISNGLKKFKLENDLVLYRRIEFNPYKGLKEKDIKRIPEFTSTSIYENRTVNKPCLITIYAPKGTRGAYIKDLSEKKNQEEFLIDKDVLVEVISNKENDVILRILP